MSALKNPEPGPRPALPRMRLRPATAVIPATAAAPAEMPAPASQAPVPPTTISISKFTGFAPMPRITATFGEVHAHVLRRGDMIRTFQGNFLKITAVDQVRLDNDFLTRYPTALPIRIRRNALGPGLPANDVLLAPAQRVRPGPPRSGMPFVPAAQLMGRPFVDRPHETQITYTRFSLGKPSLVYCEGLCCELDE